MFIVSPAAVALTVFAFLPLDAPAGSKASAPASRTNSPIVDRAGFFSPAAEQEAVREIERLKREKQVEVRVETFESVPDGQASKVEGMSSRERAEFFSNWLKEIAREEQAKGVLILICKEPSHLRVGISKELYRRGFGDQQRGVISERLLRGFRSKDYDRGLSDAIAYIQSTADRSSAEGAAAAGGGQVARRQAPRGQQSMGSGIGGLLCVGLVIFLGVMVVMSLVRMFRRPQVPQGYGGYGHPGQGPQGYGQQYPGQYSGGGYGSPAGGWGGGGMFGGLMSGLGGALLGNYLYDRWNTPSGGAGHTPMDPGAGAGPMYDDSRYQDFTSSGGDFGDSGGGDFGGGGDWGGGDGGDGGGDF